MLSVIIQIKAFSCCCFAVLLLCLRNKLVLTIQLVNKALQ